MIHFHSLKVAAVKKETEDCVTITFEVPEEKKSLFSFIQGQNLTVRKFLNGQEVRRNYSICTSPLEHKLTIAVKKVSGGLFSTYANEELTAGEILDVLPPTGSFFTDLKPEQSKNYIAIAAGSGITPIISILKTTLNVESKSTFTLIYGNRTKNSIIFKEELDTLKDKHMDRFSIHHVLSKEITDATINTGRIDKEKCDLYFTRLVDVKQMHNFFLCGPESMTFCIRDYLLEKGVESNRIHFELFSVPTAAGTQKNEPEEKGASSSLVSVKMDGISFDFSLDFDAQTILEAALEQGADLPYACKGGVCTTCKAKLVEGEVTMDRNWGLDEEELAKGFILTCQSHPLTPRVKVDFDQR